MRNYYRTLNFNALHEQIASKETGVFSNKYNVLDILNSTAHFFINLCEVGNDPQYFLTVIFVHLFIWLIIIIVRYFGYKKGFFNSI